MVDIKPISDPLFLREDNLREAIELLFFAYRGFTAEPDRILQDLDFGRAHHRVVYFVGRNPGINVGDLLDILKVTKQSLARILKTLVEEGYIAQEHGPKDRRQRLLTLTDKGVALELALSSAQFSLLTQAFEGAGQEAVEGFRKVLRLIDAQSGGDHGPHVMGTSNGPKIYKPKIYQNGTS